MTDRQESRAKGTETRKANAAFRKAAREAHDRQEAEDKALVSAAMRDILSDKSTTAKERIFATLTLDHITGSLIPWSAAQLYRNDADAEAFKRALDAIEETSTDSAT